MLNQMLCILQNLSKLLPFYWYHAQINNAAILAITVGNFMVANSQT